MGYGHEWGRYNHMPHADPFVFIYNAAAHPIRSFPLIYTHTHVHVRTRKCKAIIYTDTNPYIHNHKHKADLRPLHRKLSVLAAERNAIKGRLLSVQEVRCVKMPDGCCWCACTCIWWCVGWLAGWSVDAHDNDMQV